MITDLLAPLVCVRFMNEEKYREGHLRIINAVPGTKIMGLHMPDMKLLARTLAASEDACGLLSGFRKEAAMGRLCHEEKIVWGLILNRMKISFAERLVGLADFVPGIDNWAVCDSFCSDAGWASRLKPGQKEELWHFLSRYYESDKEFMVRFAIIFSMCHFLESKWIHAVFGKIAGIGYGTIESQYVSSRSLKGMSPDEKEEILSVKGIVAGEKPYYVNMGAAWLLATSLAKFPDETRAFVSCGNLPETVVKLYVRKARESFRTRTVSPF